MGILNLKWIEESDPELKDFREQLTKQYNDIEVGAVRPDRGTRHYYSDYYIQIKPKHFPPKAHFEYWANCHQGFLDLHLEPTRNDPDETKIYRSIGISLMHVLSEEGIECGKRWDLPFGYFRISGIHSVNDLMEIFKRFYGIVKGPLQEMYETKKGILSLQLNYPKQTVGYTPLYNDNEEVSVKIMKLSEVMKLNLSLPDYQREYCWEDQNITEFWHNLLKVRDGKPFHLGTVILHDYHNRYDIIDGQQRLITLSIMLLAMGYKDYLPLLNESYDSSDAQEHVANCKYLVQTLVSKVKDITALARRLAENISFAVLTVKEANLDLAYTFFSNQNSKGVPLSDFDLLKAHHLRFIPIDGQAEHMAIKWNKLTMLPIIFKEKNALYRTLGTHIYRLRRWMRKNESLENSDAHYIQREYQSAVTMPDIPPFGEKFDFYEKIQGGTHFFVYAETFIHRYLEFRENTVVKILQNNLAWGSYLNYSDSIETVLFAYYLKFGSQYLAEALYCISQMMALHRYNSDRVANDGTGIRNFINHSELVLMIDQASSPTFFLGEALAKHDRIAQGENFPINSGMDLPEVKGIKWGMYRALRAMWHDALPEITDNLIRTKIMEEYGK